MRPCNCLRVLEVAVEAALRAPSSLPAVAAAAVEHQLRPSLQHEEGEEAAAAAAAVEHLSLREVEEEEAAAAAAAEQEAVVGSAWLPFAGSSQPSVVPHRATSEVEVVVAVAGGGRKAIRQQAPLKCSWGDDLGLSVCRWLSCWGGLTRRSRCDHANTR
jgi:hypothetical protein